MAYRDDREADQARIAALEGDLAAAQKRVAELEHRESTALVVASGGALARSRANRWLGAPLELEQSRRFEGEFPVKRFEDLIVICRRIMREHGLSELLPSSLSWRSSPVRRGAGPFLMVMVNVKNGETTLEVTDRLGQLAGAIFGGIGGGVGGGAIAAPMLALFAAPYLAPVIVLGWLGGIYGLTRKIYRRAASRRAVDLQRLFDALVSEITAQLEASRPGSTA